MINYQEIRDHWPPIVTYSPKLKCQNRKMYSETNLWQPTLALPHVLSINMKLEPHILFLLALVLTLNNKRLHAYFTITENSIIDACKVCL